MNFTCSICGNYADNKVWKAREMMLGLRDEFEYVECANCGCLQIRNIPENLAKYYPKNYYSLNDDPSLFFKGTFKAWLKKQRDYFAITGKGFVGKFVQSKMPNHSIELFNFRHIAIKKSAKILDVGSGTGIIPYVFKNAGFKHITGIDPYLEKDMVFNNGLTIRKQSLLDITEKDWDIIMFNHSFEHIAEPKNYLIQTAALLKPKGICIIRIPTVSSYAWQCYKENWVQLDAPRHLFLYSIKSLEILAAQTGFDYVKTSYESTAFQFLGSEQYQKDISLLNDNRSMYCGNISLFTANQINDYKAKAVRLNNEKLGDSIAAVFIKK